MVHLLHFSLALNGGGRIFLAPHPLPFFPPCLLSCLVSYRNTWETLSALLLKTSKLKNHGFDQLVSQRDGDQNGQWELAVKLECGYSP